MLISTVFAENGTVTYVTDNILPAVSNPGGEVPSDEFYKYKMIIKNKIGKNVLNMNLYTFLSLTEISETDTVAFSYRATGNNELVTEFYKEDVLQRRFSASGLIGKTPRTVIAAGKKFFFTAAQSGEFVNIAVTVKDLSEIEDNYINARFSTSENYIYIEGLSLPTVGKAATVIVSNKDNPFEIAHAEEVFVDYNGDFNTSFKFEDKAENYVVKVNADGETYSGKIVIDETSYTAEAIFEAVYENGAVNVVLDANNAFVGNNKTSVIVMAFYDAGGKFLGCEAGNNFETVLKSESVPENTVTVKFFALDRISSVRPQADSYEITIGENSGTEAQ